MEAKERVEAAENQRKQASRMTSICVMSYADRSLEKSYGRQDGRVACVERRKAAMAHVQIVACITIPVERPTACFQVAVGMRNGKEIAKVMITGFGETNQYFAIAQNATRKTRGIIRLNAKAKMLLS